MFQQQALFSPCDIYKLQSVSLWLTGQWQISSDEDRLISGWALLFSRAGPFLSSCSPSTVLAVITESLGSLTCTPSSLNSTFVLLVQLDFWELCLSSSLLSFSLLGTGFVMDKRLKEKLTLSDKFVSVFMISGVLTFTCLVVLNLQIDHLGL